MVAIGFVIGDVKSLAFWPKALHLGLSIAQMRRTTLAHRVLSFLFNIAVLAMSINVISGAI